MQTISFYSYKGGVGRTLALAHTAIQLAKNNIKVCVLDMDLEAPGILYKFQKKVDYGKEGMIDYIYDCVINNNVPNSIDKYFYTFQNESEEGYVKIMSAGKDMNKPEYFNKVSKISWDDLFFKKNDNNNVADGDDAYEGLSLFIKLLELIETQINPDYLFIDSQSGVTTLSKLCNSVLPDKVVILLSNNEENINGSAIIYNHIQNSPYRLSKDNIPVLCVLTRIPLPSNNTDLNKEAEILQELTQRFTDKKTDFLNDFVIIHSDREVEYMESTVLQFENSSNRNIYFEYYRLLTKIVDTELLLSRERLIKNKSKYSYFEYDLRKEISDELNKYFLSVDDNNIYDTIKRNTIENPTSYEAFYKLGLVNAYLGKTFEAIDMLSKAIHLDDQNDNIYYFRGMIFLYDLHNYKDAHTDLMRISHHQSFKTASFCSNLAVCMLCLNQHNDSLRYLTESISLDKEYFRSYLIRAICNQVKLVNPEKLDSLMLKKTDIDNILSDFDMAIRLKDDLANSYYCRGSFYSSLWDFEKAIEDYTTAININKKYGVVYNNRGLVYYNQNKFEFALEDYNKAIEIDPNYEDAYFNRGILYYHNEKYRESLNDLNKTFEINQKQIFLFYYYRGKIYLFFERYEDAILDFTKAIELNPNSCWGYCNRAKTYAKLEKNAEAILDYNKAINITSNCKKAYQGRASIYEKISDIEKAEQDLIKKEEITYKESLKKEDTVGTVVDTYKFPVKYTNGKYFEFTLKKTEDGFILTDLGNTYDALKQRHEMEVPFVRENILKVLKAFGVKKYKNELVITIQPINIKTKDDLKINKIKYTMFGCVSFLNKLRLFYFNDTDTEASDYKFVHLQNKEDIIINKSQNRIDTYKFYTSYYNSFEEIEFLLVEKEGKTLITDQGKTYDMLDDIFKLSEDNVQKNLSTIMTDCQVLQNGKEFIIPINTFYNNPNSKENKEVISAKYRLFECVSFMNTMCISFKSL
jgi:tetratricopeptide (TPR) repeat protein